MSGKIKQWWKSYDWFFDDGRNFLGFGGDEDLTNFSDGFSDITEEAEDENPFDYQASGTAIPYPLYYDGDYGVIVSKKFMDNQEKAWKELFAVWGLKLCPAQKAALLPVMQKLMQIDEDGDRVSLRQGGFWHGYGRQMQAFLDSLYKVLGEPSVETWERFEWGSSQWLGRIEKELGIVAGKLNKKYCQSREDNEIKETGDGQQITGTDTKEEIGSCVPGDAESFASGRARNAGSQMNPWAIYQREKCGNKEASMALPERYQNKNTMPIADGWSSSPSPQPPNLGCLILEAKFSNAKSSERSLYGWREGGRSFADLVDEQMEEQLERASKANKVKKPGKKTPLAIIVSEAWDYFTDNEIEQALRADPNDPRYNAWEDDGGGVSDDKWRLRYVQSLRQASLYHLACIHEDVPFHNYVIIYAKEWMEDYFVRVIFDTYIGKMEWSEPDDGKCWKA